jgi:hypothetical protein
LVTSAAALLVASVVFTLYDRSTFVRAKTQDLSASAKMVGSNSTAALSFGDAKAAREILAALQAKQNVIKACTYDKDGGLLNVEVSTYGYLLHNFLVAVNVPPDGLIQYQNSEQSHAEGIELEVNGRPANWLEATVSYSFERTQDNNSGKILDNSPSQLAKLRFAVPLGHRFDISSMQYESSRETVVDGFFVSPVHLADFTLTSKHLLRNFDVRLLRNAFNRNYSDPVALTPLVNSVPEPGRSFFVELIAHGARPGS